jgi:hypothetical protein
MPNSKEKTIPNLKTDSSSPHKSNKAIRLYSISLKKALSHNEI